MKVMYDKLKKAKSVSMIATILIATFTTTTIVMSFAMPYASGYTSRENVSNTQHNWSGGDGAPSTWSPTTCEAGSCTIYLNWTIIDKNKAVGNELIEQGRMSPVNHSIWAHFNTSDNSSWWRNFTGASGYGANDVFTVTRTDITTYGKVNISFAWAVPAGTPTGTYYVDFNTTDNATTFTSSEIWENDTYFIITGEGIETKLLDPDGNDENIDAGYWGNVTADPGDTNVEWTTNYLRIENTGSYATQQATPNFTPGSWSSAKTGDSITIDTNIEWSACWTNYSTDNPGNSFVSQGSTWVSWISDTTGSHEFQFYATGEYIWVKIRILAIPSPLSGADDYSAAFTSTATGVG